jgi:hypothetical protein
MKDVVAYLTLALALVGGATAAGDPGFGNDGIVKDAHPVLVERNDDTVGSGVRLTPTGLRLAFAYHPSHCVPQFAVRPSGTLAAVCGGTVQRLRPDGRPDGGRVEVRGVSFTAVAVGADGTVAASGRASDGTTVLLRFLPDDSPDSQFGRVVVPGPAPLRQGLAVDSVGRILLANGELRRYLANGLEDPVFTPPSSPGTLVGLTRDGRIEVCCAMMSLYRLLADGTPDPSFGVHGAASLDVRPDSQFFTAAFALEPDGATVVVGGVGPAKAIPGYGFISFYAQRVRPNGSLGVVGDSPGFFDPDNDCWDEGGDWVGIARTGAIFVGGSACDETIQFAMRYTHMLHLDHGPSLTLALDKWRVRPTARGVVLSATVVVNHASDAVVYVRAAKGSNDIASGPRLRLLPGSRLGGTSLARAGRAVRAKISTATPMRLVLPAGEIIPKRHYDLVVVAQRPHLSYRALLEQPFAR